MRVFKFGGASVKNADAVRNVGRILSKQNNESLLVVISAMGKTTNKLEELVNAYYYGGDKKALFQEVKDFHTTIVSELIESDSDFYEVDNLLIELECIVEKKLDKSLSFDEVYDNIVPFGELLSTKIINTYLNRIGYHSRWIDARNFVITTEKNRSAKVVWEDTVPLIKASLLPLVKRQTIITQGFIGRSIKHKNTTLGREGSDYSGAIFAYALDAESVTIWKDVAGIMNADPKRFEDVVLIPKLSYNEAIELAYYGASVIHPKTIQPLKNKRIPLYVKSFVESVYGGTEVNESEQTLNDVQCYIVKDNQMLINIATKDFSFIVEDNLELIFGAFNQIGIQLNVMQNSAISFVACTNADERKAEELQGLLQEKFEVEVEQDFTLLTVFNYHEASSKLPAIAKERNVKLEQRSGSALQLVLEN